MDAGRFAGSPNAPSEHPLHPSNAVALRRNMRVESVNGGAGCLKHVIVHPETREVTGLVVLHDGGEWLVSVAEIASVRQGRIVLHGVWSGYRRHSFDREEFHPVAPAAAREASQYEALHDGVPLLDAGSDQVRVGRPPGAWGLGKPQQADWTGFEDDAHQLVVRGDRWYPTAGAEQAGMIRVSRRVVRRIETIDVPIREERAVFERIPGTGEGRVVVGDRELRDGETLEVTLATERVRVSKERVSLGDVTVRKEIFQHVEPAEPRTRTEELEVEGPPEQRSAPADPSRRGEDGPNRLTTSGIAAGGSSSAPRDMERR